MRSVVQDIITNHDDYRLIPDKETDLVWQGCPVNYNLTRGGNNPSCVYVSGKRTFTITEAMMHYESVITPEMKAEGWRIPSIKELGSIVQERCNIGVFNVSLFPQKGMNNHYFIAHR
ncbi:MAG: DUF1566 domain-containing protein [Cellvibrio sp.]